MSLSKFEERRTLVWSDFLYEFNEKFSLKDFKVDERKHLKNLIKKGNEYQEQLNEDWITFGYMSYKVYMQQMYRYINLQNEIILSVLKYLKSLNDYYNNNKFNFDFQLDI